MHSSRLFCLIILSCCLAPAFSATERPPVEELWRIIQQQQQEIEALKQRLNATENRVSENERKVEVAGEAIEEAQTKTPATASWAERTQIGGYGELIYNNWNNQTRGGNDVKEIDMRRLVLYLGHKFTDRLRFHSEVELEHGVAGEDSEGEIEVEQAHVTYDLTDRHAVRGGVFLVPVGILNETHEPTTFYGAERNPVETFIIPTTWWEGGLGAFGQIGAGWGYDLYLSSGLKTSADDDYRIRAGRQKVSEADANDGAWTGRLRWSGLPGVQVASTFQYQGNISQGTDPAAGSATLISAHTEVQRGPFGLRALYARWDLNGSGPKSIGADTQEGWYVEPSFRPWSQLGAFARYNEWDNEAGGNGDSKFKQWNLGFNWWPHPDVVIKADYQNQNSPPGQDEFDGFNIGLGYVF